MGMLPANEFASSQALNVLETSINHQLSAPQGGTFPDAGKADFGRNT